MPELELVDGAKQPGETSEPAEPKASRTRPRNAGQKGVIENGTSITTINGQTTINGEPELTLDTLRAVEGQAVDQGLVVITTTFPVKDRDGVQMDLVTLESLNGGQPFVVPATPQRVGEALVQIAKLRQGLQERINQQKEEVRAIYRRQQKALGAAGRASEPPVVPPAANRAQRRKKRP